MSIKIYFDMDGVLADFDGMANKLRRPSAEFNQPSELLGDEQRAAKQEFYKTIEGTDFFADLAIIPGAIDILDAARRVAGENLFILSKAPKAKNFVTGIEYQKQIARQKTEWALKHFGDYFAPARIFIVMDGAKNESVVPTKNDILIDDRPDNIEKWTAGGGAGILYTSPAAVVSALGELK